MKLAAFNQHWPERCYLGDTLFRTLITIQFNFHAHVIKPRDRKKPDITSFYFVAHSMFDNAMVVDVPAEYLKEMS